MYSLDEDFDRRLPLTHALLCTAGLLREYPGEEELYRQQMPQALETLKQAAIIQLQEQCPSVGIDLIRRILCDRKRAGKLECLGRGPTASWRRI